MYSVFDEETETWNDVFDVIHTHRSMSMYYIRTDGKYCVKRFTDDQAYYMIDGRINEGTRFKIKPEEIKKHPINYC